jgi:dihydrodipicolinate synthase/N-acetylneuraminate lyase
MRSDVIGRLDGCFTALVTPFQRTSESPVDFSRLPELIARQADAGIAGVVLCGTTGESATLTEEEHASVLRVGIRECHRRGLLASAGTGSNSTRIAVELTQHAKELGADCALIVTPYYNKPDEAGMRRHFAKLNAVGGVGAISVMSNIYPELMVKIVQAAVNGDTKLAAWLAQESYALATRLLQIGSNPAAAKALMVAYGLDCGGCREPLVELDVAQTQAIIDTCEALRLNLVKQGFSLR